MENGLLAAAGADDSWAMKILLLALAAQSLVLLLVLLRLNRLLRSIAEIGRALPTVHIRPAPAAASPSPAAALSDKTLTMPRPGAAAGGRKMFTNDLRMKFVRIDPGEFTMGNGDPDSPENERPAHKVKLTRPYWMAETPVTNAQYEQFDPDHRKRRPNWSGNDHPAVGVSWNEAGAFCLWLSQRDGREYRLPTEAEWEYAARGSDGRTFPWGDFWDAKRCNSADPGDGFDQTSPVTQFPTGASPHGILDMVGNVWEWCADWFAPGYGEGSLRIDPTGPPTGKDRACRGGSWMNHGFGCRVSMRARRPPEFSDTYVGFRVVCTSDSAAGGKLEDRPGS